MKRELLSMLAGIAILAGGAYNACAQTYSNDYTSYHLDPSEGLTSQAIYKDVAKGVYYIAQQPLTSPTDKIIITQTDPAFNPLVTFEYDAAISNLYLTVADIKEVIQTKSLVVTGTYITEGTDEGSFMMMVDKNSGTFKWFEEFPNVTFGKCVTQFTGGSPSVIAVGWRNGTGHIFPVTERGGYIISVDAPSGAIKWSKDVESNKYQVNSVGVTGVYHVLSDITKIDENTFVATGFFNEPDMIGLDDGDGALVEFDANGTMLNEYALGNSAPVGSASHAYDYQRASAITYDPSDNTVVIAGNTVGYYTSPIWPGFTCPGASSNSGLWITKVDMSTLTPVWDNIYNYYLNPASTMVFYEAGLINITNDNSGNYGVSWFNYFDVGKGGTTTYTGNAPIMKIEPTAGNQVYSRLYTSPANDGRINALCGSLVSDNIVGVGNVVSTPTEEGWNIEAYDHIAGHCLSDDFPSTQYTHSYSMFPVSDQPYKATETPLILKPVNIKLTNNVVCNAVVVGPKSGNSSTLNASTVTNNSDNIAVDYEAANKTLLIKINNDQQYKGILINNLGQTIRKFDVNGDQFNLNLGDLPAGLYYVSLCSTSDRITKIIPVE